MDRANSFSSQVLGWKANDTRKNVNDNNNDVKKDNNKDIEKYIDDDDVSSLGSQIFGMSMMAPWRGHGNETRDEVEEKPTLVKRSHSTINEDEIAEAKEHVAEEELKAREEYIMASKDHHELIRSGVSKDTLEFQVSEHRLQEALEQIEYWECLKDKADEDATILLADSQELTTILSQVRAENGGGGEHSIHAIKSVGTDNTEEEELKAREAYIYAMNSHQALVRKKVNKTSTEWKQSQKNLQARLATLQYWEGRKGHSLEQTYDYF